MAEANWVEVAVYGDLAPDSVRSVEVAGRRVALVCFGREVFALDAVCPHRGGPLDQGRIWQGKLECPWHHFLYDLETGTNVYPANVYPDDLPQLREQVKAAKTYSVRVEGEKVLVLLPAKE